MSTLVFDIETVPDVDLGRRLYGLGGLADVQVAKAMFALRRQRSGGEFLPPEQQRVIAIACALRSGDAFKGIITEDEMIHDIEGTVSGDKVERKNTRVRAGIYPGQPQSGPLEGELMRLHFARRVAGGGVPVEAQATIKLQKKK